MISVCLQVFSYRSGLMLNYYLFSNHTLSLVVFTLLTNKAPFTPPVLMVGVEKCPDICKCIDFPIDNV